MSERLSNDALPGLPTAIARPAYDRQALRPGIVHLGEGAFHRAHQALYVDDCLAAGEMQWAIVGASLRGREVRDALAPQDFLYTVAASDGSGRALRVVGSLIDVVCTPDDPDRLIDIIANPGIRIVTLTVTEKAYLRRPDGGLDADHPDIVHDLAPGGAPKTIHGILVEAISRRRAADVPPFTVLCCDNLPANGQAVRRVVIDFARRRSATLAEYIENEVAFPCSMVDRIVPATTDADRAAVAREIGCVDAWPIMTEPFTQWVIEDRFPIGRPAWERFGVTMVDDVGPFETMKLRMLNGAHSAIAYLGLLAGHATVDAAFADRTILDTVEGLWAEAATTLPAQSDLDASEYTRRLARRFGNPALAHQTRQIATDGSQKLPQRIIAPALDRLRAGLGADYLATAAAAWIAACAARGDRLPRDHFTDPLDQSLAEIFARRLTPREMTSAVFACAGFAAGDRFGEELEIAVTKALVRLL